MLLLLLLLMMMTASDAALSYDQRSVRAGPPVGPARPVRSENIVMTLNFASMIFTGKQEGIRWPSPRGAGPAERSCLIYVIKLWLPLKWLFLINYAASAFKLAHTFSDQEID